MNGLQYLVESLRHSLAGAVLGVIYGFSGQQTVAPPAEADVKNPDEMIEELLSAQNWHVMSTEDSKPVGGQIREKTIYEYWDEYLRKTYGPGEDFIRQMYAFRENGDCIVLHGGKLAAVAYELNQMYRLDAKEPSPGYHARFLRRTISPANEASA